MSIDKLTSIKIKQNDGTYSDPIPVSVLAENVECNDGNYLDEILGSVDLQEKGNIQYQLNQLLNTKVSVSELNNYVYNNLEQTVTGWLDSNVEFGDGSIVIDKSLSIEGAAADAKATTDTFYTKDEMNQIFAVTTGDIRWQIPQGHFQNYSKYFSQSPTPSVIISKNTIFINGSISPDNTNVIVRFVIYGSDLKFGNNAPKPSDYPQFYYDPIINFTPGHRVKINIKLISGDYQPYSTKMPYLDLRNLENGNVKTNPYTFRDGESAVINFQPEMIAFGATAGLYNNAIFKFSITDLDAKDKTLTIENQSADAKAVGDAVTSLAERINMLHSNSIKYWGVSSELFKIDGETNSTAMYLKQVMTELTLNGTMPTTTAFRFRLSGGLARTNSATTAKSWSGTINLIKDHLYKIKVKLINGQVTNIPENAYFIPLFSIYNNGTQQGQIIDVYENNFNESYKIIKWALEETPAVLQLYVAGQGITFTDAHYQIILEDITQQVEQENRLIELENKTIITRNCNNETYYQAFSRTNNSEKGTNLIRFAHITDTHSDEKAWKNFLIYNQYINPKVTAIIHTGDIVHQDLSDDYQHLTNNLPDILTLLALGNHDVGNLKAIGSGGATNAECKQIFISPLIEKYGNSKIISPNDNSACYYYSDVKSDNENQTLRVIVLNPYDFDENTNGTFTDRTHIHYSQNQIDWLIGVLQDANTNSIPICICAHQCDAFLTPAGGLNNPFHMNYDTPSSQGAATNHKDWNGNPICDLVEAFIMGTSLIQSYNQEEISISINTSFNSQGHFVCWFTGHRHNDRIGFLEGYHQLNICLANGGMTVTARYSDLPRWSGTKSEDCFNLYSINLATKTIGITRIGSDVIYSGEDRKKTIVSYIKNN